MYKLLNMVMEFIWFIYVGWNAFWWNYHCGRARQHDDRINWLDPNWREIFDRE